MHKARPNPNRWDIVLCGSAQEYREWKEENPNYPYATYCPRRISDIYIFRPGKVIIYGTFWLRSDADELWERTKERQRISDSFIELIRG